MKIDSQFLEAIRLHYSLTRLKVKFMKLYNRKGEIWFFASVIVFLSIYYLWRSNRNKRIMSDGVYVIGTIDKLHEARGGQGIKGWYWLNGKKYRFNSRVSKKLGISSGKRLFFKVLPKDNWDEIVQPEIPVPNCLNNEDSIKHSWSEIPECKN